MTHVMRHVKLDTHTELHVHGKIIIMHTRCRSLTWKPTKFIQGQGWAGRPCNRKSSVLTCPKECWNSVYGVPNLPRILCCIASVANIATPPVIPVLQLEKVSMPGPVTLNARHSERGSFRRARQKRRVEGPACSHKYGPEGIRMPKAVAELTMKKRKCFRKAFTP